MDESSSSVSLVAPKCTYTFRNFELLDTKLSLSVPTNRCSAFSPTKCGLNRHIKQHFSKLLGLCGKWEGRDSRWGTKLPDYRSTELNPSCGGNWGRDSRIKIAYKWATKLSHRRCWSVLGSSSEAAEIQIQFTIPSREALTCRIYGSVNPLLWFEFETREILGWVMHDMRLGETVSSINCCGCQLLWRH